MKSLFVVLALAVMVLTPKGDTLTCYHCYTLFKNGIVTESKACDGASKIECGLTCRNATISFEAAGVKYVAESRDCGLAVNGCAVNKADNEKELGNLNNYECEHTFCNTDLCNTELAAKLSTILLGGTVAIIAGLL